MVNVDVSPSVILGVGLIGSGVSLWQIRQTKPWISKDYDVVISCISLLVGGILIFQGWRLDPLLLFGQLMTTGAALSFAVEALRLRNEVFEQEERDALGGYRFDRPGGERRGGYRDGDGGQNGGNGGNGGRWDRPPQLPPGGPGYYEYEREQFDFYDGNEEYDDSTYYYRDEGVDGVEDDVRVYDTTIGEEVEETTASTASYGFGSIGVGSSGVVERGVPRFRDLGEEDDF